VTAAARRLVMSISSVRRSAWVRPCSRAARGAASSCRHTRPDGDGRAADAMPITVPDRVVGRPADFRALLPLVTRGLSGNVAIVDDSVVVPFDELPTLPGSGLRHSWDVHGTGDQLGTLNRLTGAVVAASVGAGRPGERMGVSLPLGLPDPPFFGRQAFKHTVFPMAPFAFDDYLDGFYLQCSSQWDGLRHIGSPDGWYGGWQGAAEADPETLGIHHWAARGIIGRGLLIDLVAA